MRISALLVAVACALLADPASAANDEANGEATGRIPALIEGDAKRASVFDGDSFTMAGLHIHLAGIDAPELGQLCPRASERDTLCGLMAAYELRKRLQLEPRPLRCWPQGPAKGEAVIATCAAGEDDVARQLLDAGYAFALPDAQIDYRLAEEKARASGIGLWAGGATAPWDWRKERETASAQGPEQGCVIAGVAKNGVRLYYGPLDADYGAKTASQKDVERWFCSEEQARAAGWRQPGEMPRL